jgi:hypothetical protein
MVGLVWGLVTNNWGHYAEAGLYTFPHGILGGSLFAIANLLIPTVVNNLGLGIGFMLWNGANISLGYLISRYGLFGVHPTIPSKPLLSELGISFMIGSIALYGLVKPKLHEENTPLLPRSHSSSSSLSQSNSSHLPPKVQRLTRTGSGSSNSSRENNTKLSEVFTRIDQSEETLPQALLHPELPNFGPYMMAADVSEHIALVDEKAERKRQFIGILGALIVGAILSGCLIPYVRWQQDCKPLSSSSIIITTCNPLNFIFSQCLGIYITSTIAFLGYSAFHRFMKRSMPRSVMRPAYLCGILWAIGLGGQLLSAGNIGFDQAYPLTSIGPAMISMLWSAFYFKEIEGTRNITIMTIATWMVFIGTSLRIVST